MSHDYIASALTQLRNASVAHQAYAQISLSNSVLGLIRILRQEGYIHFYRALPSVKKIHVILRYIGWWKQTPAIKLLAQISTPGRRAFFSAKELRKKVRTLDFHEGVNILSTSAGIMSHRRALRLRLGGELVCYVK